LFGADVCGLSQRDSGIMWLNCSGGVGESLVKLAKNVLHVAFARLLV